jgi:hypothetical protein
MEREKEREATTHGRLRGQMTSSMMVAFWNSSPATCSHDTWGFFCRICHV